MKNSKKIVYSLIAFILVLIIALGTLSFLYVNKLSKDEKNICNSNYSDVKLELPESDKMMFREELNKYLSYVPILEGYNTETDDSKYSSMNYGYSTDAYSKKVTTVDDLDKRLLFVMAYNKSRKFDYDIKDNYSWCNNGEKCSGNTATKVEDVNKNLKEMYNIDSIETEDNRYRVSGGIVEKYGYYYVSYISVGGDPLVKVLSEIEGYYVKDDELVIYERAGFTGYFLSHIYVLKNTNEKSDNRRSDFLFEDTYTSAINDYFKKNINDFKIFKHTFKLGSNDKYYYYKTEEYQ